MFIQGDRGSKVKKPPPILDTSNSDRILPRDKSDYGRRHPRVIIPRREEIPRRTFQPTGKDWSNGVVSRRKREADRHGGPGGEKKGNKARVWGTREFVKGSKLCLSEDINLLVAC